MPLVAAAAWMEVVAVRRFDNFLDALRTLLGGLAPDILDPDKSEQYVLRSFYMYKLYEKRYPTFEGWKRSFAPGAGSVVCWQIIPFTKALPIADVKTVRIAPPAPVRQLPLTVAPAEVPVEEPDRVPEPSMPAHAPVTPYRSALELGVLEKQICKVCARGKDSLERRIDPVCEQRRLDAVAQEQRHNSSVVACDSG